MRMSAIARINGMTTSFDYDFDQVFLLGAAPPGAVQSLA